MKPHTLRLTASTDGGDLDLHWTIVCPYEHPRPCGVWQELPDGCACRCPACLAGDHIDCADDQGGLIDGIDVYPCQAYRTDECWFAHALDEVGADDMLHLTDPIVAEWPVTLSGDWEDGIEAQVVNP